MTDYLFYLILNINYFIKDYYISSFILYFFFTIVFFTFSLPGGTLILIGSGFFFGFINGFLINIISITLGSLIFIIFSKTLLNNLFNKYYQRYSKKLSSYIKNSSYEYLILIRLVIGPPLMFQNICISMLNISIKKILISSLIGFAPMMVFLSYLGSYLSNILELKDITFSKIFSSEILIILGFFILLIVLRIFLKK